MDRSVSGRSLCRLLWLTGVVNSVLLLGAIASAGTLPLVVDDSPGDAHMWWSTGEHSSLDEYLSSLLEDEEDTGCSIHNEEARASLSRILRSANLTTNNARSIGGIFDCRRVLTGRVRLASEPEVVSWLRLRRVELSFRARFVDVSRGTVIHSVELRAVGLGETGEAATASAFEILKRDLARSIDRVALPDAELGELSARPVVIFRNSGSASAYTAALRRLPDLIPGVDFSFEEWASEGRVAVRLEGADTVDWTLVTERLVSAEGRDFEDTRFTSVDVVNGLIFISVSDPDAGEQHF